MLKFFLALLMIAGGMAETDICEGPPQCRQDGMPENFPETEEELQLLCNYGKLVMECQLHYDQTCSKVEPEAVQIVHRMIATFKEICDNDTLLHAAVVDNLECFKKATNDDWKCQQYVRELPPDHLHGQATTLIADGILSRDDYENNTHSVTQCIATMNYFACNAVQLETECGVIAKDAYVDIAQKAGPGVVAGCGEKYDLLPAIVDLHKLEEEKEQNITEAFGKRK